jgi:hypothetical protein
MSGAAACVPGTGGIALHWSVNALAFAGADSPIAITPAKRVDANIVTRISIFLNNMIGQIPT